MHDSEYGTKITERPKTLEGFGLCATCNNIEYASSAFRIKRVSCSSLNEYDVLFHLTDADPIMDCTHYDERGRLSLNEMYALATLIEIDKKEAVGFQASKDRADKKED